MTSPTTSPFAITTPTTTVYLPENRIGEMPFTVTNMTEQQLLGKVTVIPLDDAPPKWFKPNKSELSLPSRASAQVVVQVEPPLGAVAASHQFRLDVDDPATSEPAITGPSVEVVVPASQPKFNWKTPRGYLATMLGASAGGALGELIILLMFIKGPDDTSCTGDPVGCIFSEVFAAIIFFLIAIVLGLGLLWVGAVEGAWIGLRLKSYLGSKTTAGFLAVLMVPWTFGILWLLSKITDNLVVVIIVSPILLTAVPALLARGASLLIYTKRI